MTTNCGVDAIAPTGAGGREIAVLWAENRHSIGTSVPYGGINQTVPKPNRLPELGASHGAPPRRSASLLGKATLGLG